MSSIVPFVSREPVSFTIPCKLCAQEGFASSFCSRGFQYYFCLHENFVYRSWAVPDFKRKRVYQFLIDLSDSRPSPLDRFKAEIVYSVLGAYPHSSLPWYH